MMPSPHQLVINELAALNLNNIICYNDEHFATETKTCQPVALEPNKPIEQNIFSNSADGKIHQALQKKKWMWDAVWVHFLLIKYYSH